MTLAAALVDPVWIPMIVVPTIFIGLPIAIGYSRRLWTRGEEPRRGLPDESAQRLLQMQQSIDAMAIEIERISEGQRFVTKVLAARPGEALSAGDTAAKLSERTPEQSR
jgi:hypothetical protein